MSKTISIILKLVTAICALWGVFLSVYAPGTFMNGVHYFLYFTIQSNIWIAIACLIGLWYLLSGKRITRNLAILKLVFTVAITLTGLVFCFVLAPTMGPGAFVLKNSLTHVVVPIAAVADLFVASKAYSEELRLEKCRKSDAWWVTIPPLYYLFFASIGYVLDWPFAPGENYPYFFLNWGSPAGAFGFCSDLPFMGVMYYVFILLILLVLVGRLYIWGVKKVSE